MSQAIGFKDRELLFLVLFVGVLGFVMLTAMKWNKKRLDAKNATQ